LSVCIAERLQWRNDAKLPLLPRSPLLLFLTGWRAGASTEQRVRSRPRHPSELAGGRGDTAAPTATRAATASQPPLAPPHC
jgi:hypothetical protein